MHLLRAYSDSKTFYPKALAKPSERRVEALISHCTFREPAAHRPKQPQHSHNMEMIAEVFNYCTQISVLGVQYRLQWCGGTLFARV